MCTITVEKTETGFSAFANDNRRLLGVGKTVDEAVGSLIRQHPDYFDIKISLDRISFNRAKGKV